MLNFCKTIIILAFVALALASFNNFQSKPSIIKDFKFKPVDSEESYNLYDFKGKTILINFWNSGCIPCLYDFLKLVEIADNNRENFILIMVSSDHSEKQAYEFARGFCMQKGMINEEDSKLFPETPNVYIIWDEDKLITEKAFNIQKFPESILIDKDLNIKNRIFGEIKDFEIRVLTNR